MYEKEKCYSRLIKFHAGFFSGLLDIWLQMQSLVLCVGKNYIRFLKAGLLHEMSKIACPNSKLVISKLLDGQIATTLELAMAVCS